MNKSRNQNNTEKDLMDRGKDAIHLFSLEKMKDGFLLEQSCRGNSKATEEYYKGNIDRFVSYLEEQGLDTDTSSITKEQIKKYILYLKTARKWAKTQHIESNGQLTSKSVQTYVRALKAWAAWMEDEGYLNKIVSSEIKLPRATAPAIEILKEEEIYTVLKYLDCKKINHLRDLVIISVMVECGLRLEEVTKLKLANVRLNQNTLKVLGKGNKERFISFGINMQKMIFKYINQERPEPASAKVESLFLKKDGTAITQATIKQLFRRLRGKTGITKIYPHLLRHTYCTMYLAAGGDIFSLIISTGHESFSVLNNYVHLASTIVHIKDKSLSLMDRIKI